ncbi:MAG: hypothetical protein HY287_11705 [Planctomycetes bacterium]|nr:hypothetical protein [Planctomycetota bacterium]
MNKKNEPANGDVVITGLGPVTSIGTGCEALWSGLLESRRMVRDRELQVDLGRSVVLPIASMPTEANPALDQQLSYCADQQCGGHRDLAYSMLAMDLAIADARLEYDRAANNVGLIQVFEAPAVEATVSRLFQLFSTPPTSGPPPVYDLLAPSFYNMQAFLYLHVAAKAFGLRGFCTSVHNACSSAAYAIEVAAERIRSGQADVMIVAGGEAFDTAVRLEWFRRLELYAKDAGSMRPFDSTSSGFYVGEGGAAMVLENAEHAARRGAKRYACYLGGAFAHQAWKQTIPDLRGGLLGSVIKNALKRAQVEPSEIDLVIPHGASTSLSDTYEANSAKGIDWRGDGPKNSTGGLATVFKPHVGHMLASCGVIETICGLLSMQNGLIPATPLTSPTSQQFPVPLATTNLNRRIDTLLKLFTGFTGHDAAIVLRRAS